MAFNTSVTACKEAARQTDKAKYFNSSNKAHVKALNELIKKQLDGKEAPKLPQVKYIWYEAFEGWNYLVKFGRPSAMGLMPLSFETVLKYVERLAIEHKHQLILCEQIVLIDIEYVKSTQKKDG